MRWDKKIISSSVSGYLIISKIPDGVYTFNVGFPKNEWPEQTFVCEINRKDLGFVLKNFGEKGWGIFNLQTLEIAMAEAKAPKPAKLAAAKTDEFSTMLATVVNDPSIKVAEPVGAVIKPAETAPGAESKNVVEVVQDNQIHTQAGSGEATEKATISGLSKLSTLQTDSGTALVYFDATLSPTDTVDVFIPGEFIITPQLKEKISEAVTGVAAIENATEEDTVVDTVTKSFSGAGAEIADSSGLVKTVQQVETIPEQKFLNIEVTPATEAVTTPLKSVDSTLLGNERKAFIINSDCRAFASDDDFLKLRKKMVSAGSEEQMINVAKKVFRSKCFTTEQIKNLGVIFLTDEGKYNFYDAAYPFVSDSHNFSTLVSQLSNLYFINRFKAMIRQ